MSTSEPEYGFPYEKLLHEVAPHVHDAQNAWLAAIDSLTILDRRTHELIRLVCTAVLRNHEGVSRHAQFAAEAGATWDEVVCALLLTEPAFGIAPAVEALPHARRGYEAADEPEPDTDDDT